MKQRNNAKNNKNVYIKKLEPLSLSFERSSQLRKHFQDWIDRSALSRNSFLVLFLSFSVEDCVSDFTFRYYVNERQKLEIKEAKKYFEMF